ncbi:MAG: prepilin-type N-terminal cleavage/methylation domain-containing protein [Magnetococcales bacterium]|nr:prepilin-type N-terminal cleavage/methylation domain-containing protein [Magnetococcales bacterium]
MYKFISLIHKVKEYRLTTTAAQQPPKKWAGQGGFSLLELAVVLSVIGLILGGIAVGKDLVRNAEYKKIKHKFIDQWAQAYSQYYERYGVVIGDSQTDPTMVINAAVNTTILDGFHTAGIANYSAVTAPGMICQGTITGSPDSTANRTTNAATTLHSFFDAAGIEMPPGRAEGREDRYVYQDTNGNPQEVQVCFQWNPPGTRSGSGNVMIITGLTPDLARMLDTMVDGKPDAREGLFRQDITTDGTTSGKAGVTWNAVNSVMFGASATAAGATNDDVGTTRETAAERRDEDQVYIVTAHYKMTQ